MGWCDHCCGTGMLDCLCGGDLCVCERNGEYECPFCYGNHDDDGEFDEDQDFDEPVIP